MQFEQNLVSGKELLGARRKRSQPWQYEKVEAELKEKREKEGWQTDKQLKYGFRMKKPKPVDEQFENEVWLLFAAMGFQHMNRDRHFDIPYANGNERLTKQIDVFAVDEETVIFVECKCAMSGRKANFKDELEQIRGNRDGLFAEARRAFPNRKPKYIFATKNYQISELDHQRMKEFGIQYYNEYEIRYFGELVKHLGQSAKYQLLGSLFAGQKIAAMKNRIPAIEGKMGGYTYYSFSIEPDKLLKISYILHRNRANQDLMPTYQRIIKKARLTEIQKFIDKGGFFPNSLLVSIDTRGNKLRFDPAPSGSQVEDSVSRLGILYLPQQYQSAYVIDGQHRLYGYADSRFAGTNSIPVVAFVNLDKDKQVELFMEINENQKSVSKNLKNTLNADLLWESPDWNKRRRALRLVIAQKLAELQGSPLFDRILVGENESSEMCCITTDTIESGLKSTQFFSRYEKDQVIVENGTYDKGDNYATLDVFLPFITRCFDYFRSNVNDEWNRPISALVNNNSIHAIIRVVNDVVNHLLANDKIAPMSDSPDLVASHVEQYLSPLMSYFVNITEEQREEIRTSYGSGGKAKVWRNFQRVIAEAHSDFVPDGLVQWIKDNSQQFNKESFAMMNELEAKIKSDFALKLVMKYGTNWESAGLPPKVYKQANKTMGDRNYKNQTNGIEKSFTIWDCVTLENCRDIAIFGSHWTEIFDKMLVRPEDMGKAGKKEKKVEWLTHLSKLLSTNPTTYSVPEEDYLFIKSLHFWLIGEERSQKHIAV